jgi:AraC family transcriptional regulator
MRGRSGRLSPANTSRCGRLILWPGRGMYIGPFLDNETHAHHAMQLSIALGRSLRLQTHPAAPWRTYPAVITAADQSHRIACRGILAQIYFDPESAEGRRLASRLGGEGVQAIRRCVRAAMRRQLRTCWEEDWSSERCNQVIDAVVGLLAPGETPLPQDRRVTRTLDLIHASPGRVPPLAALAARVSLSPSRLAHLFRTQTGLAVRRYALWVRLNDAIRRIAAGAALTAAAHAAEFSDLAHLTRTFHRMFGMPPSALRGVTKIA